MVKSFLFSLSFNKNWERRIKPELFTRIIDKDWGVLLSLVEGVIYRDYREVYSSVRAMHKVLSAGEYGDRNLKLLDKGFMDALMAVLGER